MNENAMQKIAEKSIVANVVGGIFGGIVGHCVTEVVQDVIENVLPKPKDLGTKVVYGIGCYTIGGLVGAVAGEKMAEEMNEISGGILTAKTMFEEAMKSFKEQEKEN